MSRPAIPLVALARVATPGGPYRVGETLALAYVEPTVGRLLALEPGSDGAAPDDVDARVPETISVVVVRAAEPFVPGETLAFAFVDPTIARVHRIAAPPPHGYVERRDPTRTIPPATTDRAPATAAVAGVIATTRVAVPADVASPAIEHLPPVDAATSEFVDAATSEIVDSAVVEIVDSAVVETVERHGAFDLDDGAVAVARTVPPSAGDAEDGTAPDRAERLLFSARWSPERSRRVAQVVTRLFAIERLGWFRHALAVRVLLADEVTCSDGAVERDAGRHLQSLRTSSLEALGRPLLAASMPNFALSTAWLASLETAATARALAGLRDAALSRAVAGEPRAPADASRAVTSIAASELASVPAGSVEALLPLFVPTRFASVELSEIASCYRREALDAFAQVADATEAVRLNGMARPNRALDDRLSLLVRALGEAYDGLAVA